MRVRVVLFTSDLRVHDHPPLRAALDASDAVVPLFVRDSGIDAAAFTVPNREAFLADCLRDLDAGLRERGGRLILRDGEVTDEVAKVVSETDACAVHLAGGVSRYARRREDALRDALRGLGCEVVVHDAVVTCVPPGEVAPAGKDHFAVFTPYHRHWDQQPVRSVVRAPRAITVPEGVGSAPLPKRSEVPGVSPGLAEGGEEAGRKRLTAWLRSGISAYEDRHDDMAGDATSKLSPHLHFGTIGPVEAATRARAAGGPGAEAFVRQLAWRDFHHQVLAARPAAAHADYRSQGDRWRTARSAREDIEAWQEGRTGYPVVDAAMRQLRHEGWMHNRGRLIASCFLVKTLYVDWRVGARHFLDLLVDGDVANNQLNWQWMAGTGTDSRPNRVLNPLAQAERYDPDGAYVRQWVPELAEVEGGAVHRPWKLKGLERAALDYPDPIVELSDGLARFKRARGLD